MLPTCVAALTALLAAQPAPADDARVAYVPPPPVADLVLQALPPPPAIVVRETKTYGKVTIDHAKHLAVRASCARCHDPGPVTKIVFTTPRVAHQRCWSCHKERAAGPVHCAGCHVKTAAPVVAAAEPDPTAATTATAEGTSASVSAAGGRTTAGAAAAGVVAKASRRRGSSRHVFQLGFAAGAGVGPSLRISSGGYGFVRAYSIERLSGGGSGGRTLTSLDLGYGRPIVDAWSGFAAGVVGFDAQDHPDIGFTPVVGGRVGVEWTPRRRKLFRSVHLSLSGVSHLGFGSYGRQMDGGRFFVTLGSGFSRRE